MQCRLAASQADVSWVAVSNLHLTLRFLGEITDAQRAEITQVLETLARGIAPLRLRLSELGSFPNAHAPRVVWVGVEDETRQLPRLAAAVEQELAALGYSAREERFTAHVTLGRVRSPRHRDALSRQLAELAWTPPAACDVPQLTLMRSVLSSAGSSYTPLAQLPFTPPLGAGFTGATTA